MGNIINRFYKPSDLKKEIDKHTININNDKVIIDMSEIENINNKTLQKWKNNGIDFKSIDQILYNACLEEYQQSINPSYTKNLEEYLIKSKKEEYINKNRVFPSEDLIWNDICGLLENICDDNKINEITNKFVNVCKNNLGYELPKNLYEWQKLNSKRKYTYMQ